jgi:putative ABC transport system ATP-binding protein
MNIIEIRNLSRIYNKGKSNETVALKDVNISIKKGTVTAIVGPSGSGKSTLLNILGFMDRCTKGEYYINETLLSDIKKHRLHKVRNKYIGFVFQNFALLKEYSALYNVIMPLNYRRIYYKEKVKKATQYLEKVGLSSCINKSPNELSGGQQQRVAIARALVGEPEIILADEPTGNLDQKTGEDIINLLMDINKQGTTVIIVTHDMNIANRCDNVITLVDGEIKQL